MQENIQNIRLITNERRTYQSLPKTLANKVFRTDSRVSQGRNARVLTLRSRGLGNHLDHKGRIEQRLIQWPIHGFC